ncbi:transposase [Hymenobacter lucidus]|uniref:Transposase n=1 Tax=Hymenobacter lucidus TaxID=2880930 RepID=A0ABS8AZE3_9BACT|nr:transposase [Hymenobacter lucidus]MCB2411163.1 transposase [Hymenobacter lucidus]
MGFIYAVATDAYTCSAGKELPFRKFDTSADGSWLKIYWAPYQDCQCCPLKATCVPTARRKQLTRTAYDPAYRRAWARQQSRQGSVMRRKRQSTVEPVFGNLIHQYGLRRVGTRGKASAQKTMLLAAIAYNLKKLLKHQPKEYRTMALALPLPPVTLLCKLRTQRVVANRKPSERAAIKKTRVLQQPRGIES